MQKELFSVDVEVAVLLLFAPHPAAPGMVLDGGTVKRQCGRRGKIDLDGCLVDPPDALSDLESRLVLLRHAGGDACQLVNRTGVLGLAEQYDCLAEVPALLARGGAQKVEKVLNATAVTDGTVGLGHDGLHFIRTPHPHRNGAGPRPFCSQRSYVKTDR